MNNKTSHVFQDFFWDYSLYSQTFLQDYEHHFSGPRYAKGPSDAEGAVIKTWVDR